MIKSQDLQAGMRVRTAIGSIVLLEQVHVFPEKKSPFTPAGAAQVYIPACVLVVWDGGRMTYTFYIDEEIERVFD